MALSTAHLQITKGAGPREKNGIMTLRIEKNRCWLQTTKTEANGCFLELLRSIQLPIVVSKRRNKRIEHVQECRAILVQ